jgi:hypothetical protein
MVTLTTHKKIPEIHRRDFLKFFSMGIASLIFKPVLELIPDNPGHLGRVTVPKLEIFESPTFHSNLIATAYRDDILIINSITINDKQPEANNIWYQISDSGFAQSANLQPVSNHLNPVILDIPATGALAEITVPFTDSYRGAGQHFAKAFRLYYETTHWVTNAIRDDLGKIWYRMVDDRWLYSYYAPAECMKFFKSGELSPISPRTPPEAKRIEVRLDEQLLIAYEWDMPVFMALVSTGHKLMNGHPTTPLGNHMIYYKRPNRHMLSGTPDDYDFDLPGVPWVSYFTRFGIAIHGTYWHNNFGQPISHGCVNLPPKAAMWIYRWSHPVVPHNEKEIIEDRGTKIEVVSTAYI